MERIKGIENQTILAKVSNIYKRISNSKWIKMALNVGAKIIKLLEGNIGVNLHDLELGNICLNMAPKAQASRKCRFHWT